MESEFKRGIKIVVGGLALMAVVLLALSWLNDAKALDQSPPQEAPIPVITELSNVEDIYLRLYVDWDDKDDITSEARRTCNGLSGQKKIDCFKVSKYFDKKQISEKALSDFVEFMQEHNVK